jgi:HEAT repeat protein
VGLRRTAAWALGNIGPAAAVARRALEGLLEDPDPTVREEADEALQKLRGTYGYTGAAGEGK